MTYGFELSRRLCQCLILNAGRYVLDLEDRREQRRSAWRQASLDCRAHWNIALGMRSKSARCRGSCSRAHAAGWRLVASALLALVTFGVPAMVLAGPARRRAVPRRDAMRPVPGLVHTPRPR
jgi:hypothetical protein